MPDNKTSNRAQDTRPPGGFPSSPAINKFLAGGNSEQGTVLTVSRAAIGASNTCTVSFRGKTLAATCAHPGIVVGDSVSMIEQPQGCFWATQQQPSWFRRPLTELIAQGKQVTAAVEYLLQKFGKQWQPEVIVTLNTGGWTVEIVVDSEYSDIFPYYIYAIQTVDGFDYPCIAEENVPAPILEHIPGFYGSNAIPFTYTLTSEKLTIIGSSEATLKQLVIIPALTELNYNNMGLIDPRYWPSGESASTAGFDALWTAAERDPWTISIDGGSAERIVWDLIDYEAITNPGYVRTLHVLPIYNYPTT